MAPQGKARERERENSQFKARWFFFFKYRGENIFAPGDVSEKFVFVTITRRVCGSWEEEEEGEDRRNWVAPEDWNINRTFKTNEVENFSAWCFYGYQQGNWNNFDWNFCCEVSLQKWFRLRVIFTWLLYNGSAEEGIREYVLAENLLIKLYNYVFLVSQLYPVSVPTVTGNY